MRFDSLWFLRYNTERSALQPLPGPHRTFNSCYAALSPNGGRNASAVVMRCLEPIRTMVWTDRWSRRMAQFEAGQSAFGIGA